MRKRWFLAAANVVVLVIGYIICIWTKSSGLNSACFLTRPHAGYLGARGSCWGEGAITMMMMMMWPLSRSLCDCGTRAHEWHWPLVRGIELSAGQGHGMVAPVNGGHAHRRPRELPC